MIIKCDNCGSKRIMNRGSSFNFQTNTTGHIYECKKCEEWIITKQKHIKKSRNIKLSDIYADRTKQVSGL
jgi:DNA-directed RNA polymerase subunit RPC12/RpoP